MSAIRNGICFVSVLNNAHLADFFEDESGEQQAGDEVRGVQHEEHRVQGRPDDSLLLPRHGMPVNSINEDLKHDGWMDGWMDGVGPAGHIIPPATHVMGCHGMPLPFH